MMRGMADWTRELTPREDALVQSARRLAHRLYDGVEVPHRSCGIAMAETFDRPTAPYQALRRGGLTGRGPCGVVLSARLLLGELLGDPDPSGAVTDDLRDAMADFDARLDERVRHATCAALTEPLGDFHGPQRHRHCTLLAAETAALLAEVLLRHGVELAHLDPSP